MSEILDQARKYEKEECGKIKFAIGKRYKGGNFK